MSHRRCCRHNADHGAQLGTDGERILDHIVKHIGRVHPLIEDPLECSRRGCMALAVQPVDLRHVVTECIEQLRNERWGPRVDIEVGALPACLGNVILHE